MAYRRFMSKRRCHATTRKGAACQAAPLSERDVCLAHADADTRALVGFVPDAGALGGRPAKPPVLDVLRERVEAEIDRCIAPFEEALAATRNGEPDHAIRLRAAESVLDRLYGKPTHKTELELESKPNAHRPPSILSSSRK